MMHAHLFATHAHSDAYKQIVWETLACLAYYLASLFLFYFDSVEREEN